MRYQIFPPSERRSSELKSCKVCGKKMNAYEYYRVDVFYGPYRDLDDYYDYPDQDIELVRYGDMIGCCCSELCCNALILGDIR